MPERVWSIDKVITARAPGKLVLSGDYAVLYGAPAVAASLDRFATVSLDRSGIPGLQIEAMGALSGQWAFSESSFEQLIASMNQVKSLQLVALVLQHSDLASKLDLQTGGLRLVTDTRELAGSDRAKYGFGSSAAVLVALLMALPAWIAQDGQPHQNPAALMAQADRLHRSFQSGRGSGIDIAVACHGGCVEIVRSNGQQAPQAEALAWPDGLRAMVIWTGVSASTSEALAKIDLFKQQSAGRFDSALRDLAVSAAEAATAFRSAHLDDWLAAVQHQYLELQRFGKVVGVDIVSAPHRRIHAICERYGWAYKPSGAGIGDCGIAFSSHSGDAASDQDTLKQALNQAGFQPFDLGFGRVGPRVHVLE